MMNLHRLHRVVRQRLTPKRYHHSLCVQRRAAQLAVMYGEDWYKAAAAGLLHDICHCEPHSVQLKYLAAHGILLDKTTMENPQIWHAISGQVYLETGLGIRDKAILSAVRYHTTGREDMQPLEKLVYLADATSDDRDYPGVEKLRNLAEVSMDEAIYRSLQYTMEMLEAKGLPVVEDAREAYEYYSEEFCGEEYH